MDGSYSPRADLGGIVESGPIRLCANEDEFIAAASTWARGQPFPLIPCPALNRYRRLFPDDALPPVSPRRRAGSVVSIGGRVSRLAGRLLAAATSRPHIHMREGQLLASLAEAPDEITAVVGLASEFSNVGDWPGMVSGRIGLVVGRSAPALICLIYRCLTAEAVNSEDRIFVASNPLLPGADEADTTSLSGLAHVRSNRVGALVLRGQGRECSTGLLDTVICGREKPVGMPMPAEPGMRATPCLLGQGCFRSDLEESQIVRAVDINAALVFLQSCSTIAIGSHAYPHGLSIALGLLEGTATAVIGIVATTFLQYAAEWDLEDGLAEGLPLGEIVYRMTHESRPLNGDLTRFGLLGDPGMVLPWNSADAVRRPARPPRRAVLDSDSLSRLAGLGRDVIPRLERLRWLDLSIPDDELLALREELRSICQVPYHFDAPAKITALELRAAEMQADIVKHHIELIFQYGWSFIPSAAPGFREIFQEAAACTNCGQHRATRSVLGHVIEPDLYVQVLQCRRCGNIWWTTEPGERSAVLSGPVDMRARLGEACFLERELRNSGNVALRGAVGYSFRHYNRGLPPGWAEACDIAPGESQHFRAPVDLLKYKPQRDTHTTPFIALVNGIYTASAVMLQVY
jgi:hypothetical protein